MSAAMTAMSTMPAMNTMSRGITASQLRARLPTELLHLHHDFGVARVATVTTWDLQEMSGRLIEISGHRAGAQLTVAFGLVLDAQQRGEIAAWLTMSQSSFFPPDVAEFGVELAALPVIRATDVRKMARATAELLRSGAFTLVVLDLVDSGVATAVDSLPAALLTNLAGLAQKHDAVVIFLTDKPAESASISSLVSLRAQANHKGLACEVEILKDKRRGPGRRHTEVCRGPAGLR